MVGIGILRDQTQAGRRVLLAQLAAPARRFLETETGSAGVLLAAAIAGLVWANSPGSDAYESLWGTEVAIQVGGAELGMDLGHWVNDGLLAVFPADKRTAAESFVLGNALFEVDRRQSYALHKAAAAAEPKNLNIVWEWEGNPSGTTLAINKDGAGNLVPFRLPAFWGCPDV